MYIKESDAQKAVEETGFGKFNIKITAFGALIYLNCGLCMCAIGFVNSAAACDYQMTTIDKGRINIAVTLGMVIGSCIWGCLSDLKGRKGSLVISLFVQFLSELLSSVIPSYWTIVFLKVFTGIGITGQMSVMFPYIGEFQPTKYRNQIMSWMELFWSFGIILASLLAWAVIPLEFTFKSAQFWFSSWNLFALLNSLPALLTGLYLLTLPETPKFLAETSQLDILLKVLTRMFTENTGQDGEQLKDKLSKCGVLSLSYLVSESAHDKSKDKAASMSKCEKLNEMIENFKSQIKLLVRKPYVTRLFICSTIVFCLSSTYYSLIIWFPELLQRFAIFEKDFPNESASVCTISEKLASKSNSNNTKQTALNDPFGCDTPLDTTVYINSIWLGVACFPAAVILPLTVDRLGYRVYLILSALVSCAMVIGFFFVENSTQNVLLSSIFEACTSINISIIYCLLVELFPTNVRVMALAIIVFISRTGSLFGNMLLSYLIDDYCITLIIIMAIELLIATAACWMTPTKSEMDKAQSCDNVETKL